MIKQSLVIDAWIREAQDVSRLVEDIENRIKNKVNLPQEHSILEENAKTKLVDVGVKLDRLESLLYNPPSKPILTKEDTKFRWEMLADFRKRTRVLAFSLYTSTSAKRAEGYPVSDAKGTNGPTKSNDQDHTRPFLSKDDPEMLKPLLSADATQSEVEIKQSGSCIPKRVLRKVCWIICLILVAATLLLLLVILGAVI